MPDRSFYLLVKKDVQLYLPLISIYGVLGCVAVGLFLLRNHNISFFGGVLLYTAIIALGYHVVMRSVIHEKKENSHRFLMTLPVRPGTLIFSKLFANLIVFLVVFVIHLTGLGLVFSLLGDLPAAILAYYFSTYVIIFACFCLFLVCALLFESEGGSILVMILNNMFLIVFLNWLPNYYEVNLAYEAGSIRDLGFIWPGFLVEWSSTALVASLCLIGIIVATQFNKKEFL